MSKLLGNEDQRYVRREEARPKAKRRITVVSNYEKGKNLSRLSRLIDAAVDEAMRGKRNEG